MLERVVLCYHLICVAQPKIGYIGWSFSWWLHVPHFCRCNVAQKHLQIVTPQCNSSYVIRLVIGNPHGDGSWLEWWCAWFRRDKNSTTIGAFLLQVDQKTINFSIVCAPSFFYSSNGQNFLLSIISTMLSVFLYRCKDNKYYGKLNQPSTIWTLFVI